MDCLICHEDIIRTGYGASIECGHIFHGKCVIKWLDFNDTCPICRQNLSETWVRPLFLANTGKPDDSYKFDVYEVKKKVVVPTISIQVEPAREYQQHQRIAEGHKDSGCIVMCIIQISVIFAITLVMLFIFQAFAA